MDQFPRTTTRFLDEMDSILGFSLSRLIFDGTNTKLNRTENAQPATMAISLLILRILEKEFGFNTASRVDVTLGHSLGEFTALVAGGYLNFADALKLVRHRAEVMCHGDLTTINLDIAPGQYKPNFAIKHSCRNWDRIYEFATDRNISGTGIE